jgi:peptide subunit release factor 1 (eRF1)
MITNKNLKPQTSEDTKNRLSVFIGKISGKGHLELEIGRLNSLVVKLELDLLNARTQLEKREALARQAVADRQDAESHLKQELVRVQTLSHELETIRAESPEKLEFREIENLSLLVVKAYISKLSSLRSPTDDLLTVYLPCGTRLSGLLRGKVIDLIEEEKRILLERLEPKTGFVLFYDCHHMICEAIVLPIPIKSSSWELADKFATSFLEEILSKDYSILVIILHAGESFIGLASHGQVFDIKDFVRSSVKEKHSKGGFSQRRFERLREEDISHHMDKVFEALDKVLEKNTLIDFVILSGDSQLIKEIQKRLPINIETIEKPSDIKIEKTSCDDILRTFLISRRYLL